MLTTKHSSTMLKVMAFLGHGEMAHMKRWPELATSNDFDEIDLANNIAKDLLKQLFTLNLQTETEKIHLRTALIRKEAIKLLCSSLSTTINIQQNRAMETELIFTDPTGILLILKYLLTNASRAIDENGGAISLTLENRKISEGEFIADPPIKPGHFVVLSVRDNEPGTPSEIWEKIFEPHFANKEGGKGTGMSFSMVDCIVKSCGGFITWNSQGERGTVFIVALPIFEGQLKAESKPVESRSPWYRTHHFH